MRNQKEIENTRRQTPISVFKKSMDHRGLLDKWLNKGWQWGTWHVIWRLWNVLWFSSEGDRTELTQSVLVEYFPSPWWSAATPETQTSRTPECLAIEYFLERGEEPGLLTTDCYGLMCIVGLTPPSSLLSSPDPNHWFSVLDAHSSYTKIIFLQCPQACFIFLDKLYTLDTVLSVKWEHSDSAAARKYMPSILESLVES